MSNSTDHGPSLLSPILPSFGTTTTNTDREDLNDAGRDPPSPAEIRYLTQIRCLADLDDEMTPRRSSSISISLGGLRALPGPSSISGFASGLLESLTPRMMTAAPTNLFSSPSNPGRDGDGHSVLHYLVVEDKSDSSIDFLATPRAWLSTALQSFWGANDSY